MKYWVFVLIIVLLTACQIGQQDETKENKERGTNPYKNLSTENETNEPPLLEDPLGRVEEEIENENEEPFIPPLDNHLEPVEPEKGNEIDAKENRALQQKIPDTPETLEEIKELDQEPVPDHIVRILPFEQFSSRWNAVTDTQFSNLYIRELHGVSKEDESYYQAPLSNVMELRVFVEQDYIQALEIIYEGKPTSIEERTQMLMGWAQIINILHPDLEIYDVDSFFGEIGIGPNSDISQIKEGVYPYYHIEYQISNDDKQYRFRGTYR